jgi:hypothetical protein
VRSPQRENSRKLSSIDALELTLLVARKTRSAIRGSRHGGCCDSIASVGVPEEQVLSDRFSGY